MQKTSELFGARFAIDYGKDKDLEVTEMVEGILYRRSIRRYTDQDVPDELLDVLLACAQSAPTKSNLQQYSIIIVSDSDSRSAFQRLCPSTDWLVTCPIFLVFCADMRRNQLVGEFRGYNHENNNLDTFLNATVDAALAMQCFITAAESTGLGCAPISEVRNRIDEVSKVLGLPKGVFPVSGLTAGWPAQTGYVNQRLPKSVVVHRNRYNEASLESEIAAYDKRRHEIFPIPTDRQLHTDIYGVTETCTWSENVARQLSLSERPEFRTYLNSQGFDLV